MNQLGYRLILDDYSLDDYRLPLSPDPGSVRLTRKTIHKHVCALLKLILGWDFGAVPASTPTPALLRCNVIVIGWWRDMETTMANLYGQLERVRAYMEVLNEGIEPQFIQMAVNFEACQLKWRRVEQELGVCKEVLAKAETERGALEVKLKHARNQVDVEIRRRQRAEAEFEKLDRQIQLIRDLLVSECCSNSIQLNEEQRSALAFLNTCPPATSNPNSSRRLSTIDESASILSDISYDKTDDSMDWDSSILRTVKLKKRHKRRSSQNHTDGPSSNVKKSRSTALTTEKEDESILAKTTVVMAANGDPVKAVSTIETIPYWTRSRRRAALEGTDTDSVQFEPVSEIPRKPERVVAADPIGSQGNLGTRQHDFISKTCRDCRVVAHPECHSRCALPCVPCLAATPVRFGEGTLADYVPASGPMIPSLPGLYRVCGVDRTVKELKEKFLHTKTVPSLSKVEDVHVICSLLKDFFRNLKEPLLTFHLNQAFMEAAEIEDDDNSIAMMYQTISDLPQANRDTLAFLILHLQRVFGPTIVGHAVPDPGPMTILQDTKRQPKVVERLIGLPVEYWSQFMVEQNHTPHVRMESANCYSTPDQKVSMLGPLTTPEHKMNKTPSSSSLSQRMKSALSWNTPKFGSKCGSSSAAFSRHGNFFDSPLLR
ncbi:hypothetical protein JZ751_018162 [Albula glossodonta]|uniref:Rho-GAP domain-containing protein n=1 Tax=Albula glossodonta TaxID=121402 RepID=A0A8T2PQ57_9TELE|nr:hypothetical protein JZ751_018162 [Albula glossodonta]